MNFQLLISNYRLILVSHEIMKTTAFSIKASTLQRTKKIKQVLGII